MGYSYVISKVFSKIQSGFKIGHINKSQNCKGFSDKGSSFVKYTLAYENSTKNIHNFENYSNVDILTDFNNE